MCHEPAITPVPPTYEGVLCLPPDGHSLSRLACWQVTVGAECGA